MTVFERGVEIVSEDEFVPKSIDTIISKLLSGKDVVYDEFHEVRWEEKAGSITFVNVPYITYDDPADTNWYCLPYESEKVLVAYLKHPDVTTDGDPINLDYEDVKRFVLEMGLLT